MGKKEELCSCLNDCGCDHKFQETFLQFEEEGYLQSQILLLKRYRKELMSSLHDVQGKIDCVDYTLHKLEKCKDQ